jgi:hypothetical protein
MDWHMLGNLMVAFGAAGAIGIMGLWVCLAERRERAAQAEAARLRAILLNLREV